MTVASSIAVGLNSKVFRLELFKQIEALLAKYGYSLGFYLWDVARFSQSQPPENPLLTWKFEWARKLASVPTDPNIVRIVKPFCEDWKNKKEMEKQAARKGDSKKKYSSTTMEKPLETVASTVHRDTLYSGGSSSLSSGSSFPVGVVQKPVVPLKKDVPQPKPTVLPKSQPSKAASGGQKTGIPSDAKPDPAVVQVVATIFQVLNTVSCTEPKFNDIISHLENAGLCPPTWRPYLHAVVSHYRDGNVPRVRYQAKRHKNVYGIHWGIREAVAQWVQQNPGLHYPPPQSAGSKTAPPPPLLFGPDDFLSAISSIAEEAVAKPSPPPSPPRTHRSSLAEGSGGKKQQPDLASALLKPSAGSQSSILSTIPVAEPLQFCRDCFRRHSARYALPTVGSSPAGSFYSSAITILGTYLPVLPLHHTSTSVTHLAPDGWSIRISKEPPAPARNAAHRPRPTVPESDMTGMIGANSGGIGFWLPHPSRSDSGIGLIFHFLEPEHLVINVVASDRDPTASDFLFELQNRSGASDVSWPFDRPFSSPGLIPGRDGTHRIFVALDPPNSPASSLSTPSSRSSAAPPPPVTVDLIFTTLCLPYDAPTHGPRSQTEGTNDPDDDPPGVESDDAHQGKEDGNNASAGSGSSGNIGVRDGNASGSSETGSQLLHSSSVSVDAAGSTADDHPAGEDDDVAAAATRKRPRVHAYLQAT
jgi:hypothetical protein